MRRRPSAWDTKGRRQADRTAQARRREPVEVCANAAAVEAGSNGGKGGGASRPRSGPALPPCVASGRTKLVLARRPLRRRRASIKGDGPWGRGSRNQQKNRVRGCGRVHAPSLIRRKPKQNKRTHRSRSPSPFLHTQTHHGLLCRRHLGRRPGEQGSVRVGAACVACARQDEAREAIGAGRTLSLPSTAPPALSLTLSRTTHARPPSQQVSPFFGFLGAAAALVFSCALEQREREAQQKRSLARGGRPR